MSNSTHDRQSPSGAPAKTGADALDHEAKHVGNLTQAKGSEQDDSELERKERIVRVEQDARNQASGHIARSKGEGDGEPEERLNQDG